MKFLYIAFASLLLTILPVAAETDVLVYGATPGGISAALAAAKNGNSVELITPETEIGGLLTSGLSHPDFHSFESLSGTFLDFSNRVVQYYAEEYGPDSDQVESSFKGTSGEPKVNLLVLKAMLAEFPKIRIRTETRLREVSLQNDRIIAVSLQKEGGAPEELAAGIFIDGSYEGDLMAAAGVPRAVGREGRDAFGESLAPEKADNELQAYNFRLTMTQDPENRVLATAPEGYDRAHFEGVLPVLEAGKIDKVFGYPPVKSIFKAQTPPLPNGKYDINDVSRGIIRLSLPGENLGWSDGDEATRQEIFDHHVMDQIGLLYFLQNDKAVPEKFREEARSWGFPKDEFINNDHLPRELYVREARRMKGVHIFVQADVERAPGDVRAKLFPDAIAMADYGNNCHGTGHEGGRWKGKHTGEFYNKVAPYQIPYGVLLPEKVKNLLVPVAASSSHVGFCALRLEPVWMSLGQASGHAASLAIKEEKPVQEISLPQLQSAILNDGSATIYTSDVLPGHPDFVAVQWWGTQGGFHGLVAGSEEIDTRGEKIHGQYSEAAPAHEVKLSEKLAPALQARWLTLAEKAGASEEKLAAAEQAVTRGDFIRAIAPE
ncbi:FAD-dependent oxidoreductase [Verrucomicrobiales bacterium BCK34]|nr:FAD-dependent oxidoreductase [Verrucomicrobiales bacterium BCK34]